MTAQEQIEYVATKMMGWKRHTYSSGLSEWCDRTGARFFFTSALGWNPLEDWNHWRQVEERIMEDGKGLLIKKFMATFDGKFDYLGADLEHRVSALIAAHQELYGK